MVNLEVSQGVGVLGGGNDSQEVLMMIRSAVSAGANPNMQTYLELVLLEVLLGQVLEVSLGERSGSSQDELGTYCVDRTPISTVPEPAGSAKD